MKLMNIAGYRSVDAYVRAKIERFGEQKKCFGSLYGLMFSERENILCEETDGHHIKTTTYGACVEGIDRLTVVLADALQDVPQNAVVGMYMQNSLLWIQVYWSLLRAGYRPLLMNTRLDDARLTQILAAHGVTHVISDGGTFGTKTLFAKDLALAAASVTDKPVDRWADETILMSSDTSGNLKLCAYSGESFFYTVCDSMRIIEKSKQIQGHYKGYLKQLAFLPFCHIFGLVAVYIWFGFFARTFVFLKDYAPDTILNTIRKHKVTHIFAVPLFWDTVYASARKQIHARGEKTEAKFARALSLSTRLSGVPWLQKAFAKVAFKEVRDAMFGDSVRFLISGGSPISEEVLTFFNGIGYHLTNGFGMTEIGITSVELSNSPKVRNSASVGFPFGAIEYKINDHGELLVRGYSTATRITARDGVTQMDAKEWFNTHDLAAERDGRFYIKGRMDDLLICRNGENLNPVYVEQNLAVEGARGVCLTDLNGAPVLLVGVGRYQTNQAYDAVRQAAYAALDRLKLGQTITDIVLVTEPLLRPNEFKLNRKRLKAAYAASALETADAAAVASDDDGCSQALLADVTAIVAQVLGRTPASIGLDDNFFFDLGGSSLDYFAALSAVKQAFPVTFPTDGQTNLVTVRSLCRYLQTQL